MCFSTLNSTPGKTAILKPVCFSINITLRKFNGIFSQPGTQVFEKYKIQVCRKIAQISLVSTENQQQILGLGTMHPTPKRTICVRKRHTQLY